MKKFLKVTGGIVGVLLGIAVILAALILRPAGKEKETLVSDAEMRNVMSAAGKLSGAMFRGTREPNRFFVVTLTPGETRALLASLRRLGDPYLEGHAKLRTLATEKDLLICRVEVPVKNWMIPAVVKVRCGIAEGVIKVEFDSIRLGALPLPTAAAQIAVDRELKKFLASKEGKILPDFISNAEFSTDGALTIEATARGFKFLRERLLADPREKKSKHRK